MPRISQTLAVTLFVFTFTLISLSQGVRSQDSIQVSEPPTATVELSSIEPTPRDISKIMGFGSPAGGGPLILDPEVLEQPWWRVVPTSLTYPANTTSTFIACGYNSANPPRATLTYPDGRNILVVLDNQSDGCWSYQLPWLPGMLLGAHTLEINGNEGDLAYTWQILYPPFPVVAQITPIDARDQYDRRLLMGFAPNETLELHFYSIQVQPELSNEEVEEGFESGILLGETGGYIGSRTVRVDENGALVLEVNTTTSAPFSISTIGFTVDGYRNMNGLRTPFNDYRVVDLDTHENSEPIFEIIDPTIVETVRDTPGIWRGLNFVDVTSPSVERYVTRLDFDFAYRIGFSWCADTPERLLEILGPFELEISINDTTISGYDLVVYDEESCRFWMGLVNVLGDMEIAFKYTLSTDIFDGSNTYEAGEYVHIIDAQVD